jgi:hypothetical protein
MFTNLDYQTTSFLSASGVLANPIQPAHVVANTVNGLHAATILPGSVRGNHLHESHKEVLLLLHGRFLLRVAMLGNEGVWIFEEHIFEIGVPANPFSTAKSIVSNSPLGIEISPSVCHALKNIDTVTVGFFVSYFVLGSTEKRPEPNREVCKAQPLAFLS